MRKSKASMWAAERSQRGRLLGLTLGLLFLDSANQQGLAHGGAGPGWTPASNAVANPLHNNVVNVTRGPLTTHGKVNGSTPGLTLVVPHASANTIELGQSGQNLSIDLTSSSADIILGSKLFGGAASVTINVGGVQETFKAGSQVTAGQYVAIQQVLGGSAQSVNLSGTGAATGGSFSLNAVDKSNVTALVIPASVTALDYVSKNSTLSLHGDLTNYGSIDALSTNSKVTSGTISASDITNELGATITSRLGTAGLAGANAVPKLDLDLTASQNFANYGSITSSGGLEISAGHNLTNAPSSNSSAKPLLQALGNVNLQAPDITNAGTVKSVSGNINVAGSPDIAINGKGGQFSAVAGNINIGDASFHGTANTTLTGGDYFSNNLNVYAGQGNITGSIGQVSGLLNTFGKNAELSTATPTLTLGTSKITHDPTYADSTGDIVIDGNITVGQSLTLIAEGSITNTTPVCITATDPVSGNGQPVTLIAGASVSGTTVDSTSTNGAQANGNQTAATVTGASANGGNITLAQGTIINTTGSNNGGDVLMVAYPGTANGGANGNIYLGGTTINTYGGSSGTSGNVMIIAGGTTPVAGQNTTIVTGTINTTTPGDSTTSGAVGIYTAQALPSSGTIVSYNSNGCLSLGSASLIYDTTGANDVNGSVQINGNITSPTSITVNAGAGISEGATVGTLTAPSVALTARNDGSGTGDIGSTSAPILTANPAVLAILTDYINLSAQTSGNVYLQNAGLVQLNSSSAGNGKTFSLQTTPDPVTGDGQIALGGSVQAASGTIGTINLTSSEGTSGTTNYGGIRNVSSLLTATNVNLKDNPDGSGFGTVNVNTEAQNLTVNSQGNVFISSIGSVAIGPSYASGGGSFWVTAYPDPITGNSTITVAGDIKQPNGGDVATVVLQSIAGTTGTSNIAGIYESVTSPGTITASTISLLAIGAGDIGTASNPILTKTGASYGYVAAFSGQGNVYLQNTGSAYLVLNGSNAGTGKTFSIATTPDPVSGNGQLTLQGSMSNTPGTIIISSSEGTTGTENAGGIRNGNSVLAANSVILQDTSSGQVGVGDIGPAGYEITTATQNLTVNTAGNVSIQNIGSTTLLASSAGNGKTFSLQTTPDPVTGNGQIYIAGNVQAASGTIGTINLQSSEGTPWTSDVGGIRGGGELVATNVYLADGPGGTGSGSISFVNTTACYITANSQNSIFINNIGSVTVGPSGTSYGALFDLQTQPDPVTGNGVITIAGSITGADVFLYSYAGTTGTTNKNGIFESTSQPGTINGQGEVFFYLNGTGDVGTASNPILTGTNAMGVTAQGNVYLQNTGTVSLYASSAGAGCTFSLTTTPSATNGGQINAYGGVQAASGTIGTISLISSESQAAPIGGIRGGGGVLVANNVILQDTGNGDIGPSSFTVLTAANNISANTAGNVSIQNTGATTLLASSAGNGNTFSLQTTPDPVTGNGQITIAGCVAAASGTIGTINLTGSAGAAGTQNIGGIAQSSGTLIATNVNLADPVSGVGSGSPPPPTTDIGSSTFPILTAATNLTANTPGNVYISNAGSVNLYTSSAGNGNTFSLQTTPAPSGQDITVQQALNVPGGTISLTAGSGAPAPFDSPENAGGDVIVNGSINGVTVNLAAGSGSSGDSFSRQPEAGGTGGSIDINGSVIGTTSVSLTSGAGGSSGGFGGSAGNGGAINLNSGGSITGYTLNLTSGMGGTGSSGGGPSAGGNGGAICVGISPSATEITITSGAGGVGATSGGSGGTINIGSSLSAADITINSGVGGASGSYGGGGIGGSGGAINIGSALNATGTISVTSGDGGGAGNITGTGGTVTVSALLTGDTIDLSSGAGGAAGFASSSSGSIGNGGAIDVGSALNATGTITIASGVGGSSGYNSRFAGGNGGIVTISSLLTLTATTIDITSGAGGSGLISGSGGAINVGGSLSATGTITVTSGASGTDGSHTQGGSGGSVTISSSLTANTIDITSGGSSDDGVGGNINVGGSLTATGSITIAGGVGGNGIYNEFGQSSVGGVGGSVTISSPLIAATIDITSGQGGSGGGGIGGDGGSIAILSTLMAGAINITSAGGQDGGAINIEGSLTATGTITIGSGAPVAAGVTPTSNGNGGSITISSPLTADAIGITTGAGGTGYSGGVGGAINVESSLNATGAITIASGAGGSGYFNGMSGGAGGMITISISSPIAANAIDITTGAGGFGSGMGGGGGAINVGSALNATNVTIASGAGGSGGRFSGAGGTIDSLTTSSLTATSGNVSVSSAGALNLAGNVSSTNGSISATAGTGIFSIASAVSLTANTGNITLQNLDPVNGSISIGQYVNIDASSPTTPGFGNVTIAVGPVGPGVVGTTPANVVVSQTNQGLVLFGTNSITASAPNNFVNANGGQVLFTTGTLPASAISLGGGVTINSLTTAPIRSLDLTNAAAVAYIVSLQATPNSGVSGTLTLKNGIATGGTLIINNPGILGTNITAEDIPKNVLLQLDNFQSSTPVNVALSGTSTVSQVVLNGTMQYVGSGSNGVFTITTSNATMPLTISNTGALTSQGNLTVNAGGQITSSGPIQTTGNLTINSGPVSSTGANALLQAGGNLTVNASGAFNSTGNLSATGNLTVNAAGAITVNSPGTTIISGSNVTLTTTPGSNGSITVSTPITATNAITLSVDGTGTITRAGATTFLTAPSVSLSSVSGDIGATGPAIYTQATNLTVNTGTGNAYISQTGQVNLEASSVGALYQLTSTSGITTSGTVSAGTLSMTTGTNGNISLGSPLTSSGTITLTTNGSGNITGTGPGTAVQASSLILKSTSGNFGSTSALLANTSTLTANTTGAANIDNTANTGLLSLGASNIGGTFQLISGGAVTTTGVVTAPTLTLTTGGNFTVNNNFGSTTGTTTIISAGNVDTPAAHIRGNVITLESNNGGSFGTTSALATTANNMTVNTSGAANIDNSSVNTNLNLGASSVGGQLQLLAGGTITTTGIVTAPTLTLTAGGNSGITLGATIGAANGTTTLTAKGAGNITESNSGTTIQGNTVALSTGAGTLGTAAAPLLVAAGNLTLNSVSTAGSADINNTPVTGNLNLGASSVGTLVLTAGGAITTSGAVTASALTLSSGNNGDITVASTIGATNGTTTLIANGSGNINEAGTFQVNGNTLTLTSTSGNIGGATALLTDTKNLTVTTSGATGAGNVNLNNTGTALLTVANATAGSGFELTAAGTLTVNSISASNGSIDIVAGAGAFNVNPSSNILATNGSVTIQNSNTGGGSIAIGAGTVILGSSTNPALGQVNIVIGPVPASPVVGPTPANVTVTNSGGGQVFYGTKGIVAVAPTNKLNALGRDIVFNTGTLPAGRIQLGGNVQITADPPVGGSSSSAVTVQTASTTSEGAPALLSVAPAIVGTGALTTLSLRPAVDISASGIIASASATNASAFATNTIALTQILPQTNFSPAQAASAPNYTDTQNGNPGTLQSSIVGSTIASPATRTLYGAATEFGVPEETMFVGKGAGKIGEIEAAVVAGSEMGLDGPTAKDIQLAGWTGPATKVMQLRKGNVIVAPDQDTVIETSFGTVKVSAHSMALIMALPSGTAVYNLDDTRKNSVVLTTSKNQMTLSPGRHAMVTSHLIDGFEMVNPAESFSYRNVSSKKLDGDLQAFTSEFQVTDAIGNIKQLRAMVNSSNPDAKRKADHMLKTAAIMSQISAGGGYQQYQHPRMTAMAVLK